MTCPICHKPTAPDWRPFCCKRCADIDLARWLDGRYAIPSATDPETEAEDQPTDRPNPGRIA